MKNTKQYHETVAKVIRLTESDIERLVKKILTEEKTEKFIQKTQKQIEKKNEGFRDFFKSKEQKKREDLFRTKNLSKDIEVGDTVMVISFEGNPMGKVYDITGSEKSGFSYWVDLEKFGKMEFSKNELKVMV